jgi:YesN/AraC family two-component response regulator
MEDDRERFALSSAVEFVSILKEISDIYKKTSPLNSKANKAISSAVCTYVEDNIDKAITLSQLSQHIQKSPNHIGSAFKKENNLTVKEYINIKKVKKIADVMQNKKLSFRKACECVALNDEAYGYRLFKRYMGITPGEYMKIRKI